MCVTKTVTREEKRRDREEIKKMQTSYRDGVLPRTRRHRGISRDGADGRLSRLGSDAVLFIGGWCLGSGAWTRAT
jgi:hypothetical protein